MLIKDFKLNGEKKEFPNGAIWKYKNKNGISYHSLIYENPHHKLMIEINHNGLILHFTCFYDVNNHKISWQHFEIQECPKNIEVNFSISEETISNSVRFTSDILHASPYYDHSSSYTDFDIIITVLDFEIGGAQALFNDLDELFKNGQSSDVLFVVDEEKIPAHKLILSTRSEVFAKMFESDMLEKQSGQVFIKDLDADTFKLLLRFIYCGKLDTYEADELLKLIVVADKYSVKSLISTCEYRLIKKVNIENAIEMFLTSDVLKLEILRKICKSFIINNKDEIIGTEDFENMIKSRSDLVSEFFMNLKL